MNNVIIIGGGASGLAAAISAAKNGASVLIIEHRDRVGKKILSTGNGKCNLTNEHITPRHYYCNQNDFPWKVVSNFDKDKTLDFFTDIGLTYKKQNGYIYPRCGQASAVLDLLRAECDSLGVKTLCNTNVTKIKYCDNNFSIYTDDSVLKSDKIILAMGGKSHRSTGSDGSGYRLLNATPHKFTSVLPALTAIISKDTYFKSVSGVRCDGNIAFYVDGSKMYEESGELQFNDYGLSGIPVFDGSRFISRGLNENKRCFVTLDLYPERSQPELIAYLIKKIELNSKFIAEQQLIGFLNKKLAACILKLSGINLNLPSDKLSEKDISNITEKIKSLKAEIINVKSFDYAQVTTGGVVTDGVSCDTLESKYIKGLYIVGEMLNVDGMCGGYNLQFAWSSGILAGIDSAK